MCLRDPLGSLFDGGKNPEAPKERADLEKDSLGSVQLISYIFPLIFEKTAYLLVTNSPDIQRIGTYHFIQIAKYTGGKVDGMGPAKLEEVCYMK